MRGVWILIGCLHAQAEAPDEPLVIERDHAFPEGQVIRRPIVIAADGVTVEGNGATLIGPGQEGDLDSYRGAGVTIEGRRGVVLRGLRVRGFESGLVATDAEELLVEGCDFSDNYHDPEHGWGDGERRGGVILTRVRGSRFTGNTAQRVWNGLDLWHSDDNVVERNAFSHCSNVCLKMWGSSRNQVRDNDLSWGLRIREGEVHARDSTCVLLETGSDDNRFERNVCTHGGDGIFIRPLNGWHSTGNVFIENDVSYANNNGFESWSPGNTYLRNRAMHCSYGFWLGWSDRTVLIGNEAAFNGLPDGFHNAPESDFGHGGIVIVHGSGTHSLIEDNHCHDNNGGGIVFRGDLQSRGARWRMEHLVIQKNRLERNRYGIFGRFADNIFLAGNVFDGNEEDEHFEDVTHVLRGDGDGEGPGEVRILGPERVQVGQVARFEAEVEGGGDGLRYVWDVGGRRSSGRAARHEVTSPGFLRVSLTVHDGHLARPAWLDVYAVSPGPELATEDAPERFDLEFERQGGGAAALLDEISVAGRRSVRLRAEPYPGGRVDLVFAPEQPLDLSSAHALSFWLRARNPNQYGFDGPLRVRLAAGPRALVYTATDGARPVHPLREFPYAEARAGWVRVSVPLEGGGGFVRHEESSEPRRPHFDLGLRFDAVDAPVRAVNATAMASCGGAAYLASLDTDRLFRFSGDDGWSELPPPGPALGGSPDWINGALVGLPTMGRDGSLILCRREDALDAFGHAVLRLVRFDLSSRSWSWLPTRVFADHGFTLAGRRWFGIAHALGANYGGAIERVDLEDPPARAERTSHRGVRGPDAWWLSRAAQLAFGDGRVYAIKNDWRTPQPADADACGDRLFAFDPEAFRASAFSGGDSFDEAEWTVAYTDAEDLGPLPFEVGHGAALVYVEPRFAPRIGARGGLFIVAGCSPSDHEGHGMPSDRFALFDIESREFAVGRLPGPTGRGTSAAFHDGEVLVKRGGLFHAGQNAEMWRVRAAAPGEADRDPAGERAPVLSSVERIAISLDSHGAMPFDVWIDGFRVSVERDGTGGG